MGSARVSCAADDARIRHSFGYINGLALDSVGNLYVSDYYGESIREVTLDGTVATLAGEREAKAAPTARVARRSSTFRRA